MSLKTTSLLLSTLMSSAFALNHSDFSQYHQAGTAVQLSNNITSIAYYSPEHRFTFGAGVNSWSNAENGEKENPPGYGIFLRMNKPLTNQTVFGVGLTYENHVGNKTSARYPYFTENFFAPYTVIEFAASSQILIAASWTPISFHKTRNNHSMESFKTTEYFKAGALQLSYRF